jgi:hypothetical protein
LAAESFREFGITALSGVAALFVFPGVLQPERDHPERLPAIGRKRHGDGLQRPDQPVGGDAPVVLCENGAP